MENKPIVVIFGSRQLAGNDIKNIIRSELLSHPKYPNIIVISGAAIGVDSEVEAVAKHELKLEFQDYPANWDVLGVAAGPIRNKLMAELCTEAIAIYDKTPTKGTNNMIKQVLRLKKPLREIVIGKDQLF